LVFEIFICDEVRKNYHTKKIINNVFFNIEMLIRMIMFREHTFHFLFFGFFSREKKISEKIISLASLCPSLFQRIEKKHFPFFSATIQTPFIFIF